MRQADRAGAMDEVPVGAVIVLDGKIIAKGHNLRELRQDVTQHAEIVAIRQASRKLKSWRLEHCSLYVTLEPCLMCAGAIIQARIGTLVFGTKDPKAGACVSIVRALDLPLHHSVNCIGGVCQEACEKQLKDYFAARRQHDRLIGSRAKRRHLAEEARQKRTDQSRVSPL